MRRKTTQALCSAILLSWSATSVLPQDVPFSSPAGINPGPIITFDQADYEPGEDANFFGTGFQPRETVTLQVLHSDGRIDSGEDHEPWSVVADESGRIDSTWHVCEDDCLNSVLQLSAVGEVSGRRAAVAFSDGFVANGGFETGTLQGWSVVRDPSDPFGNNWYTYSGTFSPVSRNLIAAPPEGAQAIVSDQRGGGYQILYQDLVLEPRYTHTLSFKVYYKNWAGTFFTPDSITAVNGFNQQYRVDVIKTTVPIDSTAPGDVLATPFKTKAGDPAELPPTLITADLSAFAGTTVRLRFAVVETLNYFNGSVDDVKIVSNPVQCLTMDCPADLLAVSDPGQCGAIVNFASPAAVNRCSGTGPVTVTCQPASGTFFPVGTNPVRCTAVDGVGNSVSCTFNVVVKDNESPRINIAPAKALRPNPSATEIAAAFGAATVEDNCPDQLVPSGVIQAEEGSGCTRSMTKLWSVQDAAGNVGTASQTVTFTRDTESPVITLGPTMALGLNPTQSEIAAAFGSASVTDNCSVGLVASGAMQAEEGSGCARSVTQVWTAIDEAGNVGTASQTVTFTRDAESPVITIAPATVLHVNPSPAEIAAAFGTASVTDNCSVGLVANGSLQLHAEATGCTQSVTKTWTVKDEAGNIGTASQTLTFTRDAESPVIAVAPAAALGVNPTDAEIAAAFGAATVTDNCSVGLVANGELQPEQGTGCSRTVTKIWSVTDEAGNVGTASQTVTFTRDGESPVITLTAPATLGINPTAAEIAAAFGQATVTDNCSAGLLATAVVEPEQGSGCVHSVTKIWSATDEAGNVGTASQMITFIRDTRPPSIAGLVGPVGPIALATAATMSVNVSDDCSGVRTLTFDWSDGSESTLSNPTSTASASHAYATAGIYAVRVAATDGAGNRTEQVFQFIVVYDPTAGCVTGGGWIYSNAGTYAVNPAATGKANVGFVCKYNSSQTVPGGQTQFRFGDLNFRSDKYEWLVVNGGVAQFKGSGSLNGVSGYTFLVTVSDGQISPTAGDRFRIKIWNASRTIYDNVPGAPLELDPANLQPLNQGNIAIHK